MSRPPQHPGPLGVVFPADESGRRSSTALGRRVVADALQDVDPEGATAAANQDQWRRGYVPHLRRLVQAGLPSRDAALSIARAGLASVHAQMRVRRDDGTDTALDSLFTGAPARELTTARVTGTAAPVRELTLHHRGVRVGGDALRRLLDSWVGDGIIEPSCADAVRVVADNPDWLDLGHHTVVALGAGSEMGPLRALLRWGATVAAVDLPRPALWGRVLGWAERGAGTLLVPVGGDPARDLNVAAGADLLHELPAVAAWLGGLDGRLVLGNYVYADGATNLRLSVAVDALTTHLQARRPDTALAFLATPTDVFAVPAEAVEQSRAGWAAPRAPARLGRRALRTMSGGRLLRPAYAGTVGPGICDSLVPAQGPNYALAKRIQRWRAAVAREAGATVSLKVAPPTRTRSVLRSRALAAAYAGAHRFGVEVFEPATSNTLMAALLVHDLRVTGPARAHPWQDEADCAAHGGLWRTPYEPRSALGLAALLGLGGARS